MGKGADGMALAFGGLDQQAADGLARTHLRIQGQWIAIDQQLTETNPLREVVRDAWELVDSQKHTLSIARSVWLDGLPVADGRCAISLMLTGDLASGLTDVNMSYGLVYDVHRHLFWAVDRVNEVFVLRLERQSADASDLP